MKIIFITREGYSLAGARIRCYQFAKALNDCDMSAEVLSFADTFGAPAGEEERELTCWQKIKYNAKAFRLLWQQPKTAVFIIQRVHYHSFAPLLVHFLRGNPIVFDLDDWEMREDITYYFGCIPSSKALWLLRIVVARSTVCIAASMFLKEFLEQWHRRVFYIPSAVDTALFNAAVPRTRDDTTMIVSWVGTVHRKSDVRNLTFVMECFQGISSEFPQCRLEIVGEGIYAGNLRALIAEHYATYGIRMKGWIAPDEMPAYLANIDIGLLPLIEVTNYHKAKSPVKLFEYMAMGKPVIASRIGEAEQVIEHGKNGFLFLGKEEFVSLLKQIVQDRALYARISKHACETILQNYNVHGVQNTLAVILDAINKRQ